METETQVAEPVRAPASRAADTASSPWSGIRLGRVGDIELRAHPSWLLFFAPVLSHELAHAPRERQPS